MNRYVYSILRFVPDPVKGEFVNVGVIIGSEETNEWKMTLVGDMRRARKIDDNNVLGKVLKVADSIGRDLDLYTDQMEGLFSPDLEIGEEWLREKSYDLNNLIQATEPLPIVSDDIEDALSIVSDQFLTELERRERASVTRRTTYSRLERAYKHALPDTYEHLFKRTEVQLNGQTGHFDFVVANGSAVQVAQTWSFQVLDTVDLMSNIKAWTWEIHRLREGGGGHIKNEIREVKVPDNVDVAVLFAPPTSDEGNDALAEARVGFNEVDAKTYEIGAAQTVALRAGNLLEASAPIH